MSLRTKQIAILLAIFAAGVVTGSVSSIGVGRRLTEERLKIDNLRDSLVQILTSELGLSAEQVVRIQPLVTASCEEYRQLTLETIHKVTGLVQAANLKIAKELTPAQAEKLSRLEAERQALVQKRLDQDYLKKGFLPE